MVPFASMALELGLLMMYGAHIVACMALPLTAGMRRGHVVLGIIGGVFGAAAAAYTCFAGMPVAFMFTVLIACIPVADKPLLSQAEIEKEMAKIRGY